MKKTNKKEKEDIKVLADGSTVEVTENDRTSNIIESLLKIFEYQNGEFEIRVKLLESILSDFRNRVAEIKDSIESDVKSIRNAEEIDFEHKNYIKSYMDEWLPSYDGIQNLKDIVEYNKIINMFQKLLCELAVFINEGYDYEYEGDYDYAERKIKEMLEKIKEGSDCEFD